MLLKRPFCGFRIRIVVNRGLQNVGYTQGRLDGGSEVVELVYRQKVYVRERYSGIVP